MACQQLLTMAKIESMDDIFSNCSSSKAAALTFAKMQAYVTTVLYTIPRTQFRYTDNPSTPITSPHLSNH